jgi:uncharacterized protein (DUF1919 family)
MKPFSNTVAMSDPLLDLTMSSCNEGEDSKNRPLTTRQSTPINQRSVSFSPSDHVIKVTHLNDMSEEEVKSKWISTQELAKIRQTCMRLVTLMNLCDKKERGLDQHTLSEKARKEHMRWQLYKAVATIQKYQTKNQVWNPDGLAEICQKYSATCELEAYVVGLRDEVEVYSTI